MSVVMHSDHFFQHVFARDLNACVCMCVCVQNDLCEKDVSMLRFDTKTYNPEVFMLAILRRIV